MNAEELVMENLITEKSRMVGETLLRLLHKTQTLSILALRNYGQEEFNQVAAMIVDDPVISNILIAPGGVVTNVYPPEGNETMMGLGFFREGAEIMGAILAKESGQLVVGGPIDVAQGAQVIVGWLPVYDSGPDGSERFWGIVSVALKHPEALDVVRFEDFDLHGFDYEIWRTNPENGEKQVIFGSGSAGGRNVRYGAPYVERRYILKNAEWNYRVYYRRSWYEYRETWLLLLGSLGVSVLVAVMTQKRNRTISEQAAMLCETEDRIRLMLDTSPLCSQIIAKNFHTIDCNEAAVRLYGYANKQEYIQKWAKECMPEYQTDGQLTHDLVWEHGQTAIREGSKTFETMHTMPNGTPLPVEVTLVKVNYMGSDVIIAYTRDLREIKKLEQQAKEIYYDALTGIYNRRYFDENLERIIKSISRSNGNLSLLMVDIDFFKNYNDTYGHSAGDNCLIKITAALSETVARKDDFVARYGGEEFVVVLPHTGEHGAQFVADKLLESVRKLGIPHEKSDAAPMVTISIGGTASSVINTQKAVEYIKTADKALYMSKQNGRNRYTYMSFEEDV